MLTIEGLGRLDPAPIAEWRKGRIDEHDARARAIYGNMIGIVRQSRSRRADSCDETGPLSACG
ncbi:hypothetical protein K3N28_06270 [Glycomyces sp. TRM65418]|uniref:hypothetical protein n=1 Tax=Glycomyces sp. TRM65418 TaxID=2867006 RepID=UPI001CE4D0D4|nr:hypothetical protein [Glycomyces sp. TRM65418]MCC3762673.1 hypothetical protein [Glycomyces sp. TRM65418]QZD56708.1 hypothetical protein K3N28_06220 [Glycomyces sp. TRM65418]